MIKRVFRSNKDSSNGRSTDLDSTPTSTAASTWQEEEQQSQIVHSEPASATHLQQQQEQGMAQPPVIPQEHEAPPPPKKLTIRSLANRFSMKANANAGSVPSNTTNSSTAASGGHWKARPPPQRNVSLADQARDTIAWMCATGSDNWSLALKLCDDLSSSEAVAKEGARTLRKEIEYGEPLAQQRAARLLVILVRNSTDRFKLQVISKKFLDSVEKTYRSKSTNVDVKVMILKAMSVLGYEYQTDHDLKAFANTYNKIKDPEDPVNGSPSPEDDTSFDVMTDQSAHNNRLRNHPRRGRSNMAMNNNSNGDFQAGKYDLWAEAQIAESSAGMLCEALAFTEPGEIETNTVIQEMYTNCIRSQQIFVDAIPWATARAEESRAAKNQSKIQNEHNDASNNLNNGGDEEAKTSARLSTNPFVRHSLEAEAGQDNRPQVEEYRPEQQQQQKNEPGKQTQEELLLNRLLQANTELVEAFKLHDDILRQRKQMLDEEWAKDQSRREVRYDVSREQRKGSASGISTPNEPNEIRNIYHSPETVEGVVGVGVGGGDGDGKTGEDLGRHIHHPTTQSKNPFLSSVPARNDSIREEEAEEEEGYVVPETHNYNNYNNYNNSMVASGLPTVEQQPYLNNSAFSAEPARAREEEGPPPEPSEKALGKLRRLSLYTGDAEDRAAEQQRLEEEMRARYMQEYEASQREKNPFLNK